MPDTATISVITSGILGAGGLAFGAWNAMKERESRSVDREFARSTARNERIEERRAELYVDMLSNLERDVFSFERIYPATSPLPPPPDPLNDDEWMRLKARIAAFGSSEVVALVEEFSGVVVRFSQAWQACEMLEKAGARPGSDFAANFQTLDAARRELRQTILPAIEKRVRVELS